MLRWFNGTLQEQINGEWIDVPVELDLNVLPPVMCPECGSWTDSSKPHDCWVKQANGH